MEKINLTGQALNEFVHVLVVGDMALQNISTAETAEALAVYLKNKNMQVPLRVQAKTLTVKEFEGMDGQPIVEAAQAIYREAGNLIHGCQMTIEQA